MLESLTIGYCDYFGLIVTISADNFSQEKDISYYKYKFKKEHDRIDALAFTGDVGSLTICVDVLYGSGGEFAIGPDDVADGDAAVVEGGEVGANFGDDSDAAPAVGAAVASDLAPAPGRY